VFASAFFVGGVFLLLHQAFIAKFFTMDAIGLSIILTFIGREVRRSASRKVRRKSDRSSAESDLKAHRAFS
jgi:hypothetical protein